MLEIFLQNQTKYNLQVDSRNKEGIINRLDVTTCLLVSVPTSLEHVSAMCRRVTSVMSVSARDTVCREGATSAPSPMKQTPAARQNSQAQSVQILTTGARHTNEPHKIRSIYIISRFYLSTTSHAFIRGGESA